MQSSPVSMLDAFVAFPSAQRGEATPFVGIGGKTSTEASGRTAELAARNGIGTKVAFSETLRNAAAQDGESVVALSEVRPLSSLVDLEKILPEEALLLALSLRAKLQAFQQGSSSQTQSKETLSISDLLKMDLSQLQKLMNETNVGGQDEAEETSDVGLLSALMDVAAVQPQTTGNLMDFFSLAEKGEGKELLVSGTLESSSSINVNLQKQLASLISELKRMAQQVSENSMKQENGINLKGMGEIGGEVVSQGFESLASQLLGKQGVSDKESLFPDLVYLRGAKRVGVQNVATSAGEVRLVTLSRDLGLEPVGELQSLIDKLETFKNNLPQDTRFSSADPTLAQFMQARAQGVRGEGQEIASARLFGLQGMAQSQASSSAMVDAVRQAQAVIADMAERLQGDVTLDPARLRAVIHLDPPSLGRLHITLSLDESQGIHAQISAEQQDAQDFLQQNQSDLRQGLEENGFKAEDIEMFFEEFDSLRETMELAPMMARV